MEQEKTEGPAWEVLTVTLNPALDVAVTIRDFSAGQVNRVAEAASHAGGKGVNVASVLADYGHRVAVTGFLGRENAALFQALFARKQLDDRFVRIQGETRLGVKIIDPVRQQTTDINFPGLSPTAADLDALQEQLAQTKSEWIVLAGSLPPGVGAALYRDLIVTLKAQGRKVVLDTSGDALRLGMKAAPQILKPNIHELETLLGRELPTQAAVVQAAQTLLNPGGIELVVVSQGEHGACFVTPDSVLTAYPPLVAVKSAVGAGDALVAGIVAAQLRGLSLAACARLATAFALEAVTRLDAGITSPAAVEAWMAQVWVEEEPSKRQIEKNVLS